MMACTALTLILGLPVAAMADLNCRSETVCTTDCVEDMIVFQVSFGDSDETARITLDGRVEQLSLIQKVRTSTYLSRGYLQDPRRDGAILVLHQQDGTTLGTYTYGDPTISLISTCICVGDTPC